MTETEVKSDAAASAQPKAAGKSDDTLLNMLFVGFVCFVVGVFAADALNLDVLGGGVVATTLPSFATTSTSSASVSTTMTDVKVNILVINDNRCSDCVAFGSQLLAQLKLLFPNMAFSTLDYSSVEGKRIYDASGLTALPAVLFDDTVKSSANYEQVGDYLEKKGNYLSLRIGATFDPEAEICDNGVDDNGDSKVDCGDSTCSKEWMCMQKLDKPTVELFVMSHCPYGTQIEKGMLPVAELLGDKIDFEVKFCSYAMHGKTEIDEQLSQYCIQKESAGKYLPYLRCFLAAGKSADCVANVSIDAQKLSACISATDAAYNVSRDFNDKSTWLSGAYPTFAVFAADNEKYGIQGSPGLVINGVVAKTGRDSASLLEAVCVGFKQKPAECSQNLSSAAPSAGFGWSGSGSSTDASCG